LFCNRFAHNDLSAKTKVFLRAFFYLCGGKKCAILRLTGRGGRLIGQVTTAAQNKKSVKCPGTLVSGGI